MSELSLLDQLLVFYGTRLPDHPRKWWLHNRLRRWLGAPINRDIEVVRSGLRWSLNPSDHGHKSLFWLGAKYPRDVAQLRRLVEPGMVILEVGAEFGYLTVTLAAALERRCRIHALEPNPANYERLVRHIAWNGLEGVVQAHCLGASDEPATVRMHQSTINSGHTIVAPDGEIEGVRLTTLDDFCVSRARSA